MSESKVHHPDKSWKRLISEAKLGKTRQYFQMRREYRALKAVGSRSLCFAETTSGCGMSSSVANRS
jgi:hypothetical protein